MSYKVGKVYKVNTLVITKKGKKKMRKRKVFDLFGDSGMCVDAALPKKERPFYQEFIALANEEGVSI